MSTYEGMATKYEEATKFIESIRLGWRLSGVPDPTKVVLAALEKCAQDLDTYRSSTQIEFPDTVRENLGAASQSLKYLVSMSKLVLGTDDPGY